MRNREWEMLLLLMITTTTFNDDAITKNDHDDNINHNRITINNFLPPSSLIS